ncbi:hypothetical protein QQG55_4590 [Brugia pahangi]|uniref:Uncharacterized protein n=1 Tax=Brugia pahangi TaxID=6280 RepID=A0A0N4TQE0_BRUPA|nr:unnamed protein product [Brugia pahangi]
MHFSSRNSKLISVKNDMIESEFKLLVKQQQPQQLIPSNNCTTVAGGSLDVTTATVTSSMTPVDPQPFFSLSLPPKEKFKLAIDNAGDSLSKRQSRRTVTVLDGNYRVNSAENERYQLSRQDASVSHARRSPLGRSLLSSKPLIFH